MSNNVLVRKISMHHLYKLWERDGIKVGLLWHLLSVYCIDLTAGTTKLSDFNTTPELTRNKPGKEAELLALLHPTR